MNEKDKKEKDLDPSRVRIVIRGDDLAALMGSARFVLRNLEEIGKDLPALRRAVERSDAAMEDPSRTWIEDRPAPSGQAGQVFGLLLGMAEMKRDLDSGGLN